jgi:DNA (cytosine-5)-methyltransferase 1
MLKLKVLDLFAGAGGLSNGFEQTGKFEVKIAVEINKNASKTYKENHPHVKMQEDITKLKFKDMKTGELLKEFEDIDVIIGGPPCQGFSNANRQKNTLISSNNQLVKEYLRAIEEIRPKAFVMENVRTMDSEKHKFYLNIGEDNLLNELDIIPQEENIAIGKKTDFSENLLFFINEKNELQEKLTTYLLKQDVFSKLNSLLRNLKNYSNTDYMAYLTKETNKKYFNKLLDEKTWHNAHHDYWDKQYQNIWYELRKLIKGATRNEKTSVAKLTCILEDIIETQKVLNKINEVFMNKIKFFGLSMENKDLVIKLKTYNVFNFIKQKLTKLGYVFNEGNHIFNAAQFGVPQERKRLVLIGVLEKVLKTETKSINVPKPIFENENDYYNIYDAISDLENICPNTDVSKDEIFKISPPNSNSKLNIYLNNREDNLLYNHVRTDSSGIAIKRFSALREGQNFHDLDDSLKTTYSDHSRTQNTIYKRLRYNAPSDTVLNARKSMWIHPILDRAISIREAARLQSFQDSYRFYGPKDSQYQQIGNAVPPLFARSIAESVLMSLGKEVSIKIKDILKRNTELDKETEDKKLLVTI